LRFSQQNQFWEQKRVARSLAKAVMQFWCSAEVLLNRDDPSVGQKNCNYSLVGSRTVDGNEVSKDKIGESDMVLVIYLRPSFLVNTLCDDCNSTLYKWFFLLAC
jgi:hypothetical protein